MARGNPNHGKDGKFSVSGYQGIHLFSPTDIHPADPQPLATAYRAGANAFHSGLPKTAHNLTGRHAEEFERGHAKTQKKSKFEATIKARKK